MQALPRQCKPASPDLFKPELTRLIQMRTMHGMLLPRVLVSAEGAAMLLGEGAKTGDKFVDAEIEIGPALSGISAWLIDRKAE